MKKIIICILVLCIAGTAIFFKVNNGTNDESAGTTGEKIETGDENSGGKESESDTGNEAEQLTGSDEEDTSPAPVIINPEGKTIATRIAVPRGYTREQPKEGSLAEFLANYSLKKYDKPVLLYDGSEKGNQNAHVGVFKLPIEERDLQQCADSIMRVYAEYYYETAQYDKIKFHFTNGFLAEYSKWMEGYRIVINGNNVSWSKTKGYDDSYETFVEFMRIVFTYAGTLSMDKEATPVKLTKVKVGDIFIKGGSPGHVVMVVDVCENEQGEKAFLLAQGYMPAQEFHLLKNPLHENDPWYYVNEIEHPLRTPEYTFDEGSLKRLGY